MNKPILFFDGLCSLCNGFVDFIFKNDSKEHFLVSSLQGSKASEVLPKELVTDLNTVVLYIDGKTYQKSTAVLMVLKELSFPWNLTQVFFIIPSFIRDYFYMRVSINRYLMFGKKDSCRLPTPSERSRFLD